MRVLLLEDDEETAAALSRGLQRSGLEVRRAASCPQALALIDAERFDVAVLDLLVPGGSGYDILGRIRETGDDVPVLILTARDEVADRVEGLERGADDYLVKPFAFAELLARIRAIARRPARRMETMRLEGELVMDPVHRTVVAGKRRVDLTRVEFDILWALGEQRGGPVTRRDLLAAVWGYRFDPGTNVVDVHVARLRRKLEASGAAGTIRTVRGVGYAVA